MSVLRMFLASDLFLTLGRVDKDLIERQPLNQPDVYFMKTTRSPYAISRNKYPLSHSQPHRHPAAYFILLQQTGNCYS